jgi:cyclopropane fatty-acyl-phospholipid synthase-like methyltransferase
MINPGRRINDLQTCLLTVLSDCDSVLELGCGLGDKLAATPCKLRVGVDAFRPYLDAAYRKWGSRLHELHVAEAQAYMETEIRWFDAVMMIDFIEHLTLPDAMVLLERCKVVARRKVIVFCPIGECPQDKDTYSLGGDKWQTHRSTWTPEQLKTQGFDVALWRGYREKNKQVAFAVWSRNS